MTPLEVLDLVFEPAFDKDSERFAESLVALAAKSYRDRIQRENEWMAEYGAKRAKEIINA